MALGAGRETKEDEIDPAVGITLLAKPGEEVVRDQPLARVAWNDEARLAEAMEILGNAWTIGAGPYEKPPLVKGEVRA
jgi:pyrimidine-nucleoside phosphorylase